MVATQGERTETDVRATAAYSIAEAARYLKLPSATLRSWALGRQYPTIGGEGRFGALIAVASQQPPLLSFLNLVEAHVLRALRTEHGVSVKALRTAINYSEKSLGITRLLLSPELRTDAGNVFLDRYGELIQLSHSGQLAMRRLLEEHLKQVEWDETKLPIRLYPFLPGNATNARHIAIDPRIAFGRPVVLSKGISTMAIVDRIDAGEMVDDIASDYGLDKSEIEQAALYEQAA